MEVVCSYRFDEQFVFEETIYSLCRESEEGCDGAWEVCKAVVGGISSGLLLHVH